MNDQIARNTPYKDVKKLIALLNRRDFYRFKKFASAMPALPVMRDARCKSLLHHAVRTGERGICEFLLEKGISATCQDERGFTPLHFAADHGYAEIVELLLKTSGPSHALIGSNGTTPLHIAAGLGRMNVVKLLLERGADPQAKDRFGRLPVHFAVGAERLEIVKWLVRSNPDTLERPDDFGQRPIHWALYYQSDLTATWLIQRGVDLKQGDLYGRSPVCFPWLSEHMRLSPLIRSLRMEKGMTGDGKTDLSPMLSAILEGRIHGIKKRLLEEGALNRQESFGWTPLHAAAFSRNRDLYRWMGRHRAKAKVRDDYGWLAQPLLLYRELTKPEEKKFECVRADGSKVVVFAKAMVDLFKIDKLTKEGSGDERRTD